MRHFQPLTAPDALHPIHANIPASFLKQLVDPPIAVTAILGRQGQDCLGQRIFVSPHDHAVTLRPARLEGTPLSGERERELLDTYVSKVVVSEGHLEIILKAELEENGSTIAASPQNGHSSEARVFDLKGR